MNKDVLLDKLSEFLMVEQCGWQLYRVVAGRTANAKLKARYEAFGEETDQHRTILIDLITELGGDPNHVSPVARIAQAKSEALLASALVAGGLTDAEREANDLENVLLAETKDHADWELLGELTAALPKGKVRAALERAVTRVGPQEDEHLTWAKKQLADLGLQAVMGAFDVDRDLQQLVLSPEVSVKTGHPAPIGTRSLLVSAKAAQRVDPPVVRTTD